jgi:NADH-quinone oxidoreductase subunit F
MGPDKTYEPLAILNAGVTGAVRGKWRESLDEYRQQRNGYAGLKKVLAKHEPKQVVDMVKESGLRGRGGAGFPAGMKWGFIPPKGAKPHYVCCNADESEPGTFSNRSTLEQRPHLLIEGMAICGYAVSAEAGYIYTRGEYHDAIRVMEEAIAEAHDAGLLGKNILGSGFDFDLYVHPGGGAYICGEETALLESLEGRRGYPRLRPPFPAVEGLYACPTVINNVETLADVALIFQNSVEWFRGFGTEKSPGTKVFCLSGQVKRPGIYEAELGVPLRTLIFDEKFAGGMRDGKAFKACCPGGSSSPLLFEDHLDVAMDYEGPPQHGSVLGSTAIIVMDETVCLVWAALNLMEFYHHESCGQCTPCREGTGWMHKILKRLETGEGRKEDIETLESICDNIAGRSVCALGEFATGVVKTAIGRFREEFLEHVRRKKCPFDKGFMSF